MVTKRDGLQYMNCLHPLKSCYFDVQIKSEYFSNSFVMKFYDVKVKKNIYIYFEWNTIMFEWEIRLAFLHISDHTNVFRLRVCVTHGICRIWVFYPRM